MNNLSKKAIALELTRMWCAQYGAPASSKRVLKVYKENLKGLCEYNHKGEMDSIDVIDSIREIVGGVNSDN